MAWTKISQQRRRPNRARTFLKRPMLVELLEARAMLAADPLVGFRLAVADPVTLKPQATIHAGEEFALVAYVDDLRSQAEGVYSAYLDINFPAAQFEVSGQTRPLGGFLNGIAGTVGTGIVDEVGGFTDSLKPPGGAEQLLVAIPFIARQAGEFVFTADAADISTGHEVLLFGQNTAIPAAALQFQDLRVTVLPDRDEVTQLTAIDDEFFIRASSSANTLAVLANDSSPAPSSMTIVRLDSDPGHGQAKISDDKKSIEYIPTAGFTGTDTFQYSITNSHGQTDSAKVIVFIESNSVADKKALFQIVITDRNGQPVSAVNEGDEFLLKAVVSDVRENPQGVFAAYADIAFPPQLARPIGPLEFAANFSNGVSGDTSTPGLIDEAGAFASRFAPSGDGAFMLFQVPMKALHSGKAVFQSGPADIAPDHQSLLFGRNLPLQTNEIGFGQAPLEIRPAVIVVDDSRNVTIGSGPVVIDVLANDQPTSTSPLTITQVDTTGLRGTVSIAADGRSLTYNLAADSRGTETFRYTAANALGSATANVTIHVQPLSTLDDVVQIRLATTDRDGKETSTVTAGETFKVEAWIRDLRELPVANRGIYAAYFDLLYDFAAASVVPAASSLGFDVTFGSLYQNGDSGSASIPGLLDEIGAFQTGSNPTGPDERLLFAVSFQANAGQGRADSFVASEDTAIELNVLANDQPNQGVIQFQSDPADLQPDSDVLLFEPVQPVADNRIRYLSTSINVSGGAIKVASVVPSLHGGKVTILQDGQLVRYEPPANYFGPDEFRYSLGQGSETIVHLQVGPANDAPQANLDRYVATQQKLLQVTAEKGVLSNDSDVDRDTLSARLISSTSHGSLTLNPDGSFSYVPASGFAGTDQFTYQASDGKLNSSTTTVTIEVSPPVAQIRVAATDASGNSLNAVTAGDSFVLHALVKDRRDDSRADRGIGAAYVDVAFDPKLAQPRLDAGKQLGFDVVFGPKYQNIRTGDANTAGLLNDVGAMQTLFTPPGRDEMELFAVTFQSTGPIAQDDSVQVSRDSTSNLFDVLENESGKSFRVVFQSKDAANSPHADIVLFAPAQAIRGSDVEYGSTSVELRNSTELKIDSFGTSAAGGNVSIDPMGRGIRYTPPTGFVGTDSFTYTVSDPSGDVATATVSIEVIESWSNENENKDVNADTFVSTIDALQVINHLNTFGSRKLDGDPHGSAYYDVNKDGFVTPIDALILINFLANALNGGGEGEAATNFELSDQLNDLQNPVLSDDLFQSPSQLNVLSEDRLQASNTGRSASEIDCSMDHQQSEDGDDPRIQPLVVAERTDATFEAIDDLLSDEDLDLLAMCHQLFVSDGPEALND